MFVKHSVYVWLRIANHKKNLWRKVKEKKTLRIKLKFWGLLIVRLIVRTHWMWFLLLTVHLNYIFVSFLRLTFINSYFWSSFFQLHIAHQTAIYRNPTQFVKVMSFIICRCWCSDLSIQYHVSFHWFARSRFIHWMCKPMERYMVLDRIVKV
jgi:hypothetical protein